MDQLSEMYSSASPFAYVLNNPVMFIDPDGRCPNRPEGELCPDAPGGANNPIDIEEVVVRPKPKSNVIAADPFPIGGYLGSNWVFGGPSGTSGSGPGGSSGSSGGGLGGGFYVGGGYRTPEISVPVENPKYYAWQKEGQNIIEWIDDHLVAEATVALKHGPYASIILKNGFGGTVGVYSEDRFTISYNQSPTISDTKKYEVAAAYVVGVGYSYDVYGETNQVTVGIATFAAEITKNNIYVGWNPNLNIGLGIGGEIGAKIGINIPTSGWLNIKFN